MDITKIIHLLSTKIPKEQILLDEPLKNHTTFKIGGPADVLIQPSSIEELAHVIQICNMHQVPFHVMGNGSNLLVDDAGYRGVMIQVYKNFSRIQIHEETIIAEGGALLSKIANQALEHGLTGFEFAHGIPGTLGGAVAMNAGAYDGEIKDVLVSCTVMDAGGQINVLSKEELELGYRTSLVQKQELIVLSARLHLKPGDKEAIQAKMKDFMGRRRDKQPLDKPSAGSTFKRPEGHFAGKLIMDAGLRGYKVGGAMVSDKHCGFVVNDGNATFQDVMQLISDIKRIVKEQFDVELEPEVKIIKNQGK